MKYENGMVESGISFSQYLLFLSDQIQEHQVEMYCCNIHSVSMSPTEATGIIYLLNKTNHQNINFKRIANQEEKVNSLIYLLTINYYTSTVQSIMNSRACHSASRVIYYSSFTLPFANEGGSSSSFISFFLPYAFGFRFTRHPHTG